MTIHDKKEIKTVELIFENGDWLKFNIDEFEEFNFESYIEKRDVNDDSEETVEWNRARKVSFVLLEDRIISPDEEECHWFGENREPTSYNRMKNKDITQMNIGYKDGNVINYVVEYEDNNIFLGKNIYQTAEEKNGKLRVTIEPGRKKLDIYKFINSRDIREYLKNDIPIYEFSPEQIAWLIFWSTKTTQEEKYEAFEDLIEFTADFEVDIIAPWEKHNIKSFHDMLRQHIELSKKYTDKYFNLKKEYTDPHIYKVKICETTSDDKLEYGKEYENGYYKTFKDACESIKKEIEEHDTACPENKVLYSEVYRIITGKNDKSPQMVRLNRDLKITETDFVSENLKEDFALRDAFEQQWFEFPLPFEKGDILCKPETVNYGEYPQIGPFYIINDEVFADTENIKDITETYGDFKDSKKDHYSFWDVLCKNGKPFSDHEYDYYPRGRVAYNYVEDKYIIYVDSDLNTQKYIDAIIDVFEIPIEKYTVELDEHYKCHKCNPDYHE